MLYAFVRPLSFSDMKGMLFHKPVIVQRGRIDRDRVILSVRDAAEFLLRDWPAQDSDKRKRAMQACLEVIRGQKSPGHARRAFIIAAKEARILIDDWSTKLWLPAEKRKLPASSSLSESEPRWTAALAVSGAPPEAHRQSGSH